MAWQVRRGEDWRAKARCGLDRQGRHGLVFSSTAWQAKVSQCVAGEAWPGAAWTGMARRGTAGEARRGRAGIGAARKHKGGTCKLYCPFFFNYT